MKRILAVFLAVAMLACSLSACGGATTKPGTSSDETSSSDGAATTKKEISVGIAQDLDDSLDPFQSSDAGTREVMFNVFEGLVKPDATGNFVEAVASSVEVSEDGRSYAFTLRDGVVFHNGEPCTMDDVLYSFDTCAATSVYKHVVEALSAVQERTVEGNTLTFHLGEPNSDFMSVIASVFILPKDYAEQMTAPVGTGPFRFVSRSVQQNFVLERNDDYYGAIPALERVIFQIYEDSNALFTALNSGALDLVSHLTADQVNNLSNGYQVLEGTMNLVQGIYLNEAFAPFANEKVRQALCYAVDKDAMMELTADGHGAKLGSSMYPSFSKYFEPELAEAYPHDVERAKALLTEAGYPDGLSFTIKVPSNYQPHVDTAVVLAEQLAAAGINAKIEQIDWNTWLTDVYANRSFEATVVGFDASILSPTALLSRWVSDSSKNLINYKNPEYDQTYAAAQNAGDDVERTELYRRCLRILSDTAANVYLQDLADFVAIHPALEGYQFYPMYVMDLSTLH